MSSAPSTPDAVAPVLPRSAAHFGLSLAALAGGLGAIWLLAAVDTGIDSSDTLLVTMIACAVVALIVGAGDLFWQRVYRNASTGLSAASLRRADPLRIVVRLWGLGLTLGLVLFAYWLFPEYGSWYDTYWRFLHYAAMVLLPLAVPYFWWTDKHLENPKDAYWHLGMLALRGRLREADGALLKAHFMGWTVKAFFLALMVVFLNNDVRVLVNTLHNGFGLDQLRQYGFLYNLSYTVDLLFCVVGYTMTLRLFDSHIRSTEPTAFGWVIAIICYQPFWDAVIGRFYLHYDDDIAWDNWLTPWPPLLALWPVIIVGLLFIYSAATVSFGLRFSNLTYRGIITSGPYRYSKHPAYISKNISWWLISVPWVSNHGWTEALRNTCLLGLVSFVYYLRARTEERHLSKDPDYVAYALWIEQHGLLRGLGKVFPFLRYRAPVVVVAAEPAPATGQARPAKRR